MSAAVTATVSAEVETPCTAEGGVFKDGGLFMKEQQGMYVRFSMSPTRLA